MFQESMSLLYVNSFCKELFRNPNQIISTVSLTLLYFTKQLLKEFEKDKSVY